MRWSATRMEKWRNEIETFLKEESIPKAAAAHATGDDDDKRTWKRLSSFDIVCALDRQLMIASGHGLKLFEALKTEPALDERSHLTLCWDTGSDNVCASSYLLNAKRLRCSVFWDPLHKIWRAIWMGVRRAGLYSAVLVGGIIANLERGPWSGEANYEVEKQAAMDLSRNDMKNDTLVWELLPRILRDRGEDPSSASSARAQEVVESLATAPWLQKKPIRVATTRWGSWHDAIEQNLLPYFHEKLLVLLAVGLLQGWLLTDRNKAQLLKSLVGKDVEAAASSSTGPMEKETVKQGAEQLQALRDRCKNSLHVSVMAMSQADFHFDLSMISFASSPLRAWHGYVVKRLRSSAASVDYYREMAKDEEDSTFRKAVRKVMAPCGSVNHLERMGFIVRVDGANALKKLMDDAPEFLNQQNMADKLWRLCLSLVAQAEVNFAFHTKQYPGKLASLLTTDEREREILWEDMKKDWAAWKCVKGLRGAPWGAIAKRSRWNWLVNTEFFEEADKSGGALTPAMLRHVDRIFRFQGCEGSTEVAFQKLTNATKDNQSERLAPCTLWRRPTMWGLFTRTYSFKEVDPSMIRDDELATAELPASLNKPCYKTASLDFKDLPGKAATPPWPSFSAQSFNSLFAQQALMRYCFDNDAVKNAALSWRGEFCKPGTVVVTPTGERMLVVTMVAPVLVLWPVDTVLIGTTEFLQLSKKPVWVPCFSLEEWLAVPTRWVAPVDLLKANGGVNFEHMPDVFAQQTGPPLPLLQWAALKGFWSIPMSSVRRLAKHDLDVELTGSDADDLVIICRYILKGDALLAMQCLDHRVIEIEKDHCTAIDDIAMSDEGRDCIDKNDKQEAEQHFEHVEATKAEIKTLTTHIATKLLDMRAGLGPAAKKTKPKPAGKIPDKDELFTQARVSDLFPPHTRILKDYYNFRWKMWIRSPGAPRPGPWRIKSRSWSQEGHGAAVKDLLRIAWSEAALYGEPCPHDGLF